MTKSKTVLIGGLILSLGKTFSGDSYKENLMLHIWRVCEPGRSEEVRK